MNLHEFLLKVFKVFPPDKDAPLDLLQEYYNALNTGENRYYDNAWSKFFSEYKYKKLPSCADLIALLKEFEIKEAKPPEIIISYTADKRGITYDFAYLQSEDNWSTIKEVLIQRGFTNIKLKEA